MIDHAQGQYKSREPIGLSILVNRRYGLAADAHAGRYLSRIVGVGGGIGEASSVRTDGCGGSVDLGGIDNWRKWVGLGNRGWRSEVARAVRAKKVTDGRVREHDARANEDSIVYLNRK